MSNRTRYSGLFSIGLGVGCCLLYSFLKLPASAQILEAQVREIRLSATMSSDEILAALADWNNPTWLRHAPIDCDAAVTLTRTDAKFVDTLLLQAQRQVEQIEDTGLKGKAFTQLGRSYACANQAENARAFLIRATAEARQINATGIVGDHLADIAEVYGDLLDDTVQMNVLLMEVRSLAVNNFTTMNNITYYPLLDRVARAYAKHGQYQDLLEMVRAADGEDVRESMIVEASASLQTVIENEVDSPDEREAISQLFTMSDIAALSERRLDEDFYSSSAPSESQPLLQDLLQTSQPTEYQTERDAGQVYADQLRALQPESIAAMTSVALDAWIGEQKAIIEQIIPESLFQTFGYIFLADLLSTSGQPEAALPLFEESLQRLERDIGEGALLTLDEADKISEAELYGYHQLLNAKALIRAGDFEAGYQRLQTLQNEQDETAEDKAHFWLNIPYDVESPTFSLAKPQRLVVLATAQERAQQIDDDDVRLHVLTDIAEDYIALDERALARQMAPAIAETFELAIAAVLPGNYSILPQIYSEFLLSIEEYESAIALMESRESREGRNLLSDTLSSQFVAVGEQERAEALRVSLPSSERRLAAGLRMVYEYQSQGASDEALALTKLLLQEVQTADLVAEAIASEHGLYGSGMSGFLGVERERIDRAEHVLSLHLPPSSRIDRDLLSAEEPSAIVLDLISSIESDWLRSGAIEETLGVDAAIDAFERDAALETPDSLLLRRMVRSVESDDFQLAVSDAQRMRSPHMQSSALMHIATRYLSTVE